jgi:hypothetical protein
MHVRGKILGYQRDILVRVVVAPAVVLNADTRHIAHRAQGLHAHCTNITMSGKYMMENKTKLCTRKLCTAGTKITRIRGYRENRKSTDVRRRTCIFRLKNRKVLTPQVYYIKIKKKVFYCVFNQT